MNLLKSSLESLLEWIDFPVLIATLLGGIILWILSESSRKGKLKIFVNEKKVLGIYKGATGNNIETNDLDDQRITQFYLWIAIDVYNAAEHVKIARNIEFEVLFRHNEREILNAYRGSNIITSLNFEPRKLELIHFHTYLSKSSYSQMRRLHLTYINEAEKKKIIKMQF